MRYLTKLCPAPLDCTHYYSGCFREWSVSSGAERVVLEQSCLWAAWNPSSWRLISVGKQKPNSIIWRAPLLTGNVSVYQVLFLQSMSAGLLSFITSLEPDVFQNLEFTGHNPLRVLRRNWRPRCYWIRSGCSPLKNQYSGFPGGAVVESLPASAGDTGSSPGLGGSHMPRSN